MVSRQNTEIVFTYPLHHAKLHVLLINLPMTARVKISQNIDILAKVHLMHFTVEHCQTLRVVSTFTGQNELTAFDW